MGSRGLVRRDARRYMTAGKESSCMCRWTDTRHLKKRQAIICQAMRAHCDRDRSMLHGENAGEPHKKKNFQVPKASKLQNINIKNDREGHEVRPLEAPSRRIGVHTSDKK